MNPTPDDAARIELAPYAIAWPARFKAEHILLRRAFAGAGVVIEHVGSTAVPGLAAKPIVDILLGAPELALIEARIPALEALGYTYVAKHEAVLPERRFFAKPAARPRSVHLHAVVYGSPFWKNHLAFRDALRAHPALAQEYHRLKLDLAARFGEDRERYTEAKAPFIERVLRAIGASSI
ncbi:Dephospho-CoA kinase [Burkholderiales bacterium]|nr:MAG: GrpB family protein [Burkholderiales bacterium]CAG1011366.1 Dephospho-CoA kinase [Burkholderiales bacterium]